MSADGTVTRDQRVSTVACGDLPCSNCTLPLQRAGGFLERWSGQRNVSWSLRVRAFQDREQY